MSAKAFDFLVIGAGSGGLAAARRAASLYSKKVALFEKGSLGGTCVNVGCVPKKVMFNAATVAEMIKSANEYGFEGKFEVNFNWSQFKTMRDSYIHRLNGIYDTNLKNDKVTVVPGFAEFVSENTVSCNGELYTAPHILIATGGQSDMPQVEGIEHAIDSDGFFRLEKQPKKIAIVGAGYIAVELAGIFNALGSKVDLFVRYHSPLRNLDTFILETLNQEMTKAGVVVHPFSQLQKIVKKNEGCFDVCFQKTSTEQNEAKEEVSSFSDYDCVLVAIGRKPLVEKLGLEKTGLKTHGEKKYITVDDYQNTSVPGIYAVGDVCGKVELTPVAIAAGRKLVDRIFGGNQASKLDYSNVPTVIFSHPPVGHCGLTEAEAVKKYGAENVVVYKTRFNPMFFTPLSHKVQTAMKIVCLKNEDEKLLGIHLIGQNVDEMLQGFSVLVRNGAPKSWLDNTIAIHPSSSEEMVLMKTPIPASNL